MSRDGETNEHGLSMNSTVQEIRLVVSEGEMWPLFMTLYYFHLKKEKVWLDTSRKSSLDIQSVQLIGLCLVEPFTWFNALLSPSRNS